MSDAEADQVLLSIRPWLSRAEEVFPSDPRIAYFLRLRAVQEGLRLGATGSVTGTGNSMACMMERPSALMKLSESLRVPSSPGMNVARNATEHCGCTAGICGA